MSNINNINTRKLCKNLCNIFNLPLKITCNFLKVVSKSVVHKVSEEALSKEDGKLRKFSIDAPFICTIWIELVGNDDIRATKVEFNDDFKKCILKAVNTGESPLVAEAEKSLIESFKNRYNSLI